MPCGDRVVAESFYLIFRACYSLQIGLCKVLNKGLHLDFEVLQWSNFAADVYYFRGLARRSVLTFGALLLYFLL